ncbi:Oligoendopeptidase F [hydrothermal vent metagenome]|uniref:Oligoendopeptidase F n=1 Tax=hydrothermal vent metagenome TaxID=652676 RepID=A0A3B1CJW3_9ZZZZ
MESTENIKEGFFTSFPRKFVKEGEKIKGWEELAPYFSNLSEVVIGSVEELETWLEKWSEVSAVADEFCTSRYIAMTCHTDDEEKTEAYLHCIREVEPKLVEWGHRLNEKYMASPFRGDLKIDGHERLDRMISEDVALYSEKNIPLQIKLQELSQEYQGIMGAMTVMFDGSEKTMPQMALYLKDMDRSLRERAFKAMIERRLREKDKLEDIFDKMLALRVEWAQNLGLQDYREYAFRSKLRDYTPDDCITFHKAIEETVVPLAREISGRRKKELGVEKLAPWDTACDTKGRSPLKPFAKADELYDGVLEVFGLVDKRLGNMFGAIKEYMDLDSRKGKAPGGYQATLAEARVPFIFTNAVGSHDDVNTLLHEGGHAFHTIQCRDAQVLWLRHAGMEFSEVASMSMELIGGDHLEPFYDNEEDIERAKRERMESIVSLFAWVAQVDAFQHWIYTNPGHSRDERKKAWSDLAERFNIGTDWSFAPEGALEYAWHRQLHIFEYPFYYVEYAIAQLGALQIYRNSLENPEKSIEEYLSALALGGARSPKGLFESAGARFDFSSNLLGELMNLAKVALKL